MVSFSSSSFRPLSQKNVMFQLATAECEHSERGERKDIETLKLHLVLLMDKLIILYQIYMFVSMIMLKTAAMDCRCADDTLHFSGRGGRFAGRVVCGGIIQSS